MVVDFVVSGPEFLRGPVPIRIAQLSYSVNFGDRSAIARIVPVVRFRDVNMDIPGLRFGEHIVERPAADGNALLEFEIADLCPLAVLHPRLGFLPIFRIPGFRNPERPRFHIVDGAIVVSTPHLDAADPLHGGHVDLKRERQK